MKKSKIKVIKFKCRNDSVQVFDSLGKYTGKEKQCYKGECPFANQTEFGTICNVGKYSGYKNFDAEIRIKKTSK